MADATKLMVWIDQDLCTGDGICSEICPAVFEPRDDGLWVVREDAEHFGETIVFDGAEGAGHDGRDRVGRRGEATRGEQRDRAARVEHVERHDLAFSGEDQGIHLDEVAVEIDERPVQRPQGGGRPPGGRPEPAGQLPDPCCPLDDRDR